MPDLRLSRRPLAFAVALALGAAWLSAVALAAILAAGTALPGALGLGHALLVALLARAGSRQGRFVGAVAALAVVVVLAVIALRAAQTPRHDRDWDPAVARLPRTAVVGDELVVDDVRNFRWSDEGSATPAWETRRYRLSRLEGVDVVIEPFGGIPGLAHTMLSFDFGEDGRLLLSIEARKEIGETYGPIAGGLHRFELAYVFMDERDGLGLRSHRGHELVALPARVDPLRLRAFLLGLCATANEIAARPRFYRVVRDNCTTAWIHHADHLTMRPIGLRPGSILPGRIGRLLHERGMLATELSFDEAWARHRIDDRITDALDAPDFSRRIRMPRDE